MKMKFSLIIQRNDYRSNLEDGYYTVILQALLL